MSWDSPSDKIQGSLGLTVKLLYCASQGDKEAVKMVLAEGASVDASDYDKRTALHLAACGGHAHVIELLLEHNAFINPRDRWGRTPLADAQRYNFEEVCILLEQNGGCVKTLGYEPSAPPGADWEIDSSELHRMSSQPIGKGASGEVHIVNWRGTRVAAKTIISSLNSDPKVRSEFIGELALLQKLRHPNIVQFLGAVTKSDPLVIVTEYLPRGDLYRILQKCGRLSAAQAIRFALDIARGMNYLHEHKPDPILHRDLKPRNLLQDEAGHLKVADFGLGKLVETKEFLHEVYKMTGETGSYRYMAPEVFKHEVYDKSVDVFSFGIVVHEMFEGQTSYCSQLPQQLAKARALENLRPTFTVSNYPDSIKELLAECWDQEPTKRPTFADIILRLEDAERLCCLGYYHYQDFYRVIVNPGSRLGLGSANDASTNPKTSQRASHAS